MTSSTSPGRHHQRPGRERVRRDERDHEALHSPGQHRARRWPGCSRSSRRGWTPRARRSGPRRAARPRPSRPARPPARSGAGGRRCRSPPIRSPAGVSATQHGQLHHVEVAGRARAGMPSSSSAGLDRRQEADRAVVDREHRHARGPRSSRSAERIVPSPPEHHAPGRCRRSGSAPSTRPRARSSPCFSTSSRAAAPPRPPRAASSTTRRSAPAVCSGRAWVKTVIDSGRSLTARPSAPPPRGRSTAPSAAGLGQPDEALAVAGRARAARRRRSRAPTGRARRARLAHARRAPSRRSSAERTTPPLPTRSRPTSNCGLTRASSRSAAPRRDHRGEHLAERDEGHVGHDQVRARRAARPASSERALRRSITVTRGSLRSRQCSSP